LISIGNRFLKQDPSKTIALIPKYSTFAKKGQRESLFKTKGRCQISDGAAVKNS